MKKFLISCIVASMITGGIIFANTSNTIEPLTVEEAASISYEDTGRQVNTFNYDYGGEMGGYSNLYLGSNGRYYLNHNGNYRIVERNTFSNYNGYNVSKFRYMCLMHKSEYSQLYYFFNM